MANRTYFGFAEKELKSFNVSNVKVCSFGVDWSLTPLHLLICSIDFKKYIKNKTKDYVVVTPVESAEMVFKLLLKVSYDDEDLYSQLVECFKVFKVAAKKYKFGVGIFSEIAHIDGISHVDKWLKYANTIISTSIGIKGKSGNVIRKALSILSGPRILTSSEDLYKITEKIVGEYVEPEDFTGDWMYIR